MKLELQEIYWHGDRERIMSLDFLKQSVPLLVTAGAEMSTSAYIRLWQLTFENSQLVAKHLEDLAGTHERSVNVVRVSPAGDCIASGADDACIVIWAKKKKQIFGSDKEEEGWGSIRVLRGHMGEVHDLAWSETGRIIASASMDASVIVFEVSSGKVAQRIEGFNKLVSGVSLSRNLLAAMSNDRTLKVFKKGKKGYYIKHSVKDFEKNKLFQDESSASAFFRRLSFSQDGNLLLAPAGMYADTPVVHCFMRKNLSVPSVCYPININKSERCAALGVKMCPLYFKASESGCVSGLDYKLVWAVATLEAVLIYNSESLSPVKAVSNSHLLSLTDLAWFGDRILAVSSLDGYVSFIIFEEGELGEVIEVEQQPMEVEEQTPVKENVAQSTQKNDGKKRICPELISN